MKQQIAGTWTAREDADRARHSAACAVCREKLKPAEGQRLYAAKNARTREYVHVLVNGEPLEEKLDWPREEILYSIMLEDGADKGPPMNEETKRRLRELGQLRRSLRRAPANAPARHAEGEKEREESVAKKKTKSKAGRIFVFDLPVTRVLLWMGKNNFKLAEASAALKKAGVNKMPTEGTIRAYLGLGRTEKFAPKIAKLTAEQQKILRDAAKAVEAKKAEEKEPAAA